MATDPLGLLPLVQLRHEERSHEAKRSFPWRFKGDGAEAEGFTVLRAKVTRTIMAMANLRGGGRVVIGVNQEANGTLTPAGMDDAHLAGWTTDEVMDHVNKYASPEVQLRVDHVTDDQDRGFVIVTVQEFDEVPVVCRDDQSNHKGKVLLRRGATYVRARRKIQSVEISSQSEMRELIALATQKHLQSMLPYVTQMLSQYQPGPSDQEQFDAQLGDL